MPAFNEKKRVEALANEKCFLSYTLRFINRFFTVSITLAFYVVVDSLRRAMIIHAIFFALPNTYSNLLIDIYRE